MEEGNNQQQPGSGYSAVERITRIHDMVQQWKKAPERVALFMQLAQDDRNVLVRIEALDNLLTESNNDPQIEAFIKQRFHVEQNEAIKLAIIYRNDRSDMTQAMIRMIADTEQSRDEEVAGILEKRAGPDIFKSFHNGELQLDTEESVDYELRQAYVLRFARERMHEPDTFVWLKERAEHASSEIIRQTALHEIARGWFTVPGTLQWLQQRGQLDEDPGVRTAAFEEIALRFPDLPGVLEWLKERGELDEEPYARHAAQVTINNYSSTEAKNMDDTSLPFETFASLINAVDNPVILLEGRRSIPDDAYEQASAAARFLAATFPKARFRSGNATGSDEAFSKGVADVDPARLQVVAPYGNHRKNARFEGATYQYPDALTLGQKEQIVAKTIFSSPKYSTLMGLSGKTGSLAAKADYLLRDTMKVVGFSEEFPKVTAALFYVDPCYPMSGGTGHTIRVCQKEGVPVVFQHEWAKWIR
ncbi:MAG: HEAT repeat domain-containing protein [Pelodictyon phaeoclathratiforme]